MTSTYSPSLRLELMATGDQSGTWGVTNNTNLGTLLEQAITGVLSVAEGDTTLTLSTSNGASDQARNAVINLTGAMTAGRNVIVPTANKLYLIKNSTTGGFSTTIKTATGTGVAVIPGTNRWVYCDGTNVVDGGLNLQTLTTTSLSPTTTDGLALGTTSLMWSDLFLASGGVINWNAGDVLITHSANLLAFSGASSGYTFDAVVKPSSNDAAALGASGTAWADLFLASGGVINWNAGDVTITHSANLLAFGGASSGYTFDAVVKPSANDGAALGASGTAWSDLFLASGGVINWNAGDVLITHSSNLLAFSGASSGYTFDAVVKPSSNDGAALGASGTAWSDLFLASGGVINWSAGDVTITHSSDALDFAGAASGYSFDHTVNIAAGGSGVARLWMQDLNTVEAGWVTSNGLLAGTYSAALFKNSAGTEVGSIKVTNTATTFATSSDPRLKDSIEDLEGSGAYIDALRPRTWLWKDGSYGAGFLSTEFQEVNPRAVHGEANAVDENGAPVYQTLDASTPETMAHIVRELQLLRRRTLISEQRVLDLEARLSAAGVLT